MTPLETEIERFKHFESEDHFAGCGHRTHPCPGAGYCGDESLIHALLAERDVLRGADSGYAAGEAKVMALLASANERVKTLTTRALAAEVALLEARKLLTRAKCWVPVETMWPCYGTGTDKPVYESSLHPLRVEVEAYLTRPLLDLTAAHEIIAKAGRCDEIEAAVLKVFTFNFPTDPAPDWKTALEVIEVNLESSMIERNAANKRADDTEDLLVGVSAERDTLAAQVATMRAALNQAFLHVQLSIIAGDDDSPKAVTEYIWGRGNNPLALPITEAEKRVVQEDE